MSPTGLLRRQWEGYSRNHRSRANLLIHIVAVPGFLLGNLMLLGALLEGSRGLAVAAFLVTATAFGAQGYGHGREAVPPEPFAGPLNAVARIFLEQWVTFPRFVLSGAWLVALRQSGAARGRTADGPEE